MSKEMNIQRVGGVKVVEGETPPPPQPPQPLLPPPTSHWGWCKDSLKNRGWWQLFKVFLRVSLLPGWLAGWQVGWLVGWLAGWPVGWLVGWLVGLDDGGLRGLGLIGPRYCRLFQSQQINRHHHHHHDHDHHRDHHGSGHRRFQYQHH
ncbi:Hypothetical predicted protein [Octopus vulgaris]|uniref:Uncharacterized protein n=1 Tax=Octopus vulgaris TaxID=6645 RepID=A0AA36F2Z0_OCTVU|nr:Hypothetical predicted protein [Octopus vulgaris]